LDHTKTKPEEITERNTIPTETGWQIETDQKLNSDVIKKQQSVSHYSDDLNTYGISAKSNKKIDSILFKLAIITFILLTLIAVHMILQVFFFAPRPSSSYHWENLWIFVITWPILSFVLWKWWKKRRGNYAIKNSQPELIGEVRGFTQRSENISTSHLQHTIWNFRIERYIEGKQLPPIPVEMRGQKFEGSINEGDSIQLLKNWQKGLHKTNKVFNLTINVMVKAKQKGLLTIYPWLWGLLFFIIFWIIVFINIVNN